MRNRVLVVGGRILVVDDEPNALRLIGYALGIAGYDVVTAENGEEALIKIRAANPDLVILDIMLPDISGIEVCRQVRSDPATADLPIIMFSARVQVKDKIEGLDAGANEYVTKPVDPDEMVARVAALLKHTRRLRERQPVQRAKVLGFMGAKGGVGTTTVALNVALALVRYGNRVIAAELRSCFGTLAAQLHLTPHARLGDLLALHAGRIGGLQLSKQLAKHSSGLQVLAGPQGADDYGEMEAEQAQAVVTGLSVTADYVIIDLPCYPSAASRVAARACDRVIVVVEPEPICVAAGAVALELLQSWGVSRSVVCAAVVNRIGAASPMPLATIRQQLGCGIVGVVTPAPDLAVKSLESGRPLVISAPNSMVALALKEMTDRLLADSILR